MFAKITRNLLERTGDTQLTGICKILIALQFLRNRCISQRAIHTRITIFWLDAHAPQSFNWFLLTFLLVAKKKLRITGFFALLPFLRYLSNMRQTVNTWHLIKKKNSWDSAGIEQIKGFICRWRHFFFAHLVHALNWIVRTCAKTVLGHLNYKIVQAN